MPDISVSDTASQYKIACCSCWRKRLAFVGDLRWLTRPTPIVHVSRIMREVVRTLSEGHVAEREARIDRVGGVGAGGAVGSQHYVPPTVCKQTVPHEVWSCSQY